MFCIDTAAKAKKSARALEKSLAKQGIHLVHGHALNAVSAMAGFVDWNGYQESLGTVESAQRGAPRIQDIDFNRVTEVVAYGGRYKLDIDYYGEAFNWFFHGETDEGVSFNGDTKVLRLESCNDDAYCSSSLTASQLNDFKWNDEQQCFVNSFEQRFAVYESRPYRFSNTPETEVVKEVVATPSAKQPGGSAQEFPILDVDFAEVVGLYRGGDSFQVNSMQFPENLAWVINGCDPTDHYDEDVPVLGLTYFDDDGFAQHQTVSAFELLALKWNAQRNTFESPTGLSYRFVVEESVSPENAGRLVATEPTKPPTRDVVVSEVPVNRYHVEVSLSSDLVCVKDNVIAVSEAEAVNLVMDEVWDERVERSRARISVEQVEDYENAPFCIFLNSACVVDNEDSFSEAYRRAKTYAKHNPLSVIDLRDEAEESILKFNN